MNIDIIKIIQLLFHLVEDTELKDNKTFQIAKEVVNSIDTQPQLSGSRVIKLSSGFEEPDLSAFSFQNSALSKPEAQR